MLVIQDWAQFWQLVAWAAVIPALLMCVAWAVARALNNAGVVDVFWAYAFIPVAVAGVLRGCGDPGRSLLLLFMVAVWATRLGTYLLRRVAKHHPEEDGRYTALRAQFPRSTWLVLFGFFQVQAVLIALLSVPFALVFVDPRGGIGPFQIAGAALWLFALAGESLADRQLAHFRADPANAGKVCRSGLWNYSRHPNYFFEWLVWVAFAVYALGSPGGWIGLYAPALMYVFLTRITGIKATEEQSLRSRGDDYRAYQRATNAFFPWRPRGAR